MSARRGVVAAALLLAAATAAPGQTIAVRGGEVHTLAGPPIKDGVVLVRDGRIEAVGPASRVRVPEGVQVVSAAVVTPGLVDARTAVGLAGFYNSEHDRDELEDSAPSQPELRALDAYNPLDPLVEWVRGFGVTTIHTGHAPGELVSGQTMIAKTFGQPADAAVVREVAAVAVTLSPSALKGNGKAPGTRAKLAALLRADLVKAREYLARQASPPQTQDDAAGGKEAAPAGRDLKLEVFGRVLKRELPLLVTAHRAQDIATALRLAREFDVNLILDGASEAYLLLDEIKKSGFPVLLHAQLGRFAGEQENASRETASALRRAGIPFAIESGYEDYVPRARVVLFEAGFALNAGLSFDDALAAITREPARILGIADRVGTLEPGKDGDLALYDGDPFEYTTHCTGTVIGGRLVAETPR